MLIHKVTAATLNRSRQTCPANTTSRLLTMEERNPWSGTEAVVLGWLWGNGPRVPHANLFGLAQQGGPAHEDGLRTKALDVRPRRIPGGHPRGADLLG